MAVDLHEFINDLKLTKAFTQKQCIVIENIYVYFNDLKVYKVVIAINPLMMKKAKRLGFDSQYKTIFMDDVLIKVKEFDVSKCKYIYSYIIQTTLIALYITVKLMKTHRLKHGAVAPGSIEPFVDG